MCLALQVPQYLFASGGPLSISHRPQLAEAGLQVQRVLGAAVVLVAAVLLVGRLRRADPGRRRVLAPLALYGIFALVAVPVQQRLP